MADERFTRLRLRMVDEQLIARGISDPRVLQAMRTVPRHEFVPENIRQFAYMDNPLAIGQGQTISQPFVVAYMTELLYLQGDETVLEIGTGSGYQAAVLAQLARYVYTIERFPLLAERAGSTLNRLAYHNLDIHIGDGSQGLPDMAPFDAIVVTAAAPSVPGTLCTQLKRDGGRLVIPVGSSDQQELQRVVRQADTWRIDHLTPVRFVPLVGRFGFRDDS